MKSVVAYDNETVIYVTLHGCVIEMTIVPSAWVALMVTPFTVWIEIFSGLLF